MKKLSLALLSMLSVACSKGFDSQPIIAPPTRELAAASNPIEPSTEVTSSTGPIFTPSEGPITAAPAGPTQSPSQNNPIDDNVLDRTFPSGTEIQFIALRSSMNGLFLTAQGDGTLRPTASELSPASLFSVVRLSTRAFALVSAQTGGYVFVSPEGVGVLYNIGVGIDAWSTFYAIDLDNQSSLALQSAANGLYVSAENAGSAALVANRQGIGSWETFKMLPVLDMATTLTAFGIHHPHEAKQRTNYFYTGVPGDNADILYDRVLPGGYQMVTTHVEHDGTRIFDWMYMDGDRVGLHGAFAFCNGCKQTVVDTMIPYTRRYMTPDMAGVKTCGTWQGYTSDYPAAPYIEAQVSPPHCNSVYYVGMTDLGGNIGPRWVIAIGTDPVTWGDVPLELVYYDLGPAVGVWAPRYGYVQYQHSHAAQGVSLLETYGNLIPYEDHQQVYNYFSY